MKLEILSTGRAITGPTHWPTYNGSPISGWLPVPLLAITLLLLAACGTAAVPTDTPAPEAPVAIVPAIATPDPDYVPRSQPLRPVPLPTVNPAERESAGGTWLYLAAFQNDFVSVVDPISGHALRQIPVNADQAGMAVSPDGTRLYVVDGLPTQHGRLRIFDTKTWRVIHQEPLPDRRRLLGGNPITLSPDGQWLVVGFYDLDRRVGWKRVFDTETLEFLTEGKWRLGDCGLGHLRLAGQPGDTRVYVQCQGFVAALSAEDLSPIRRIPSPTPFAPDSLGWPKVGNPYLAVSPDGQRLYGLYPRIERRAEGSRVPVVGTDLQLLVWETGEGETVQEVMMSGQVSVPLLGASRGAAGYLAVSPDGKRLFVAWEDMLWALDGQSLRVIQELRLPAPVDGMAQSMDGRDLYLLPATSGGLTGQERGMFTVDSATLELVRRAAGWPRLLLPFFFAAPAAAAVLKVLDETTTPTAAPTPTPSPRPRFTTCSGREEEPPCGPGAEVGRPYPYTLYTHCGVRSAFFDGRRWIADPILTDSGTPPEDWPAFESSGEMKLVAANLARFTSKAGLAAGFRPLPVGAGYPWLPCK